MIIFTARIWYLLNILTYRRRKKMPSWQKIHFDLVKIWYFIMILLILFDNWNSRWLIIFQMDIISTRWKLRLIQFVYYSCLCFSLAMSEPKLYQDEPMRNSDSSTPKQSFVFLTETIEQPVYFQSLKKGIFKYMKYCFVRIDILCLEYFKRYLIVHIWNFHRCLGIQLASGSRRKVYKNTNIVYVPKRTSKISKWEACRR